MIFQINFFIMDMIVSHRISIEFHKIHNLKILKIYSERWIIKKKTNLSA